MLGKGIGELELTRAPLVFLLAVLSSAARSEPALGRLGRMAAAITTTALAFTPPVLNNFHFYSACANSVSWNPDWYTQG